KLSGSPRLLPRGSPTVELARDRRRRSEPPCRYVTAFAVPSRAVARRSSSRRPTRAHVLLDLQLRVLDRLESCRTGVVAMATKERPTLPPNLPWQPPTGLAHDGPIAERRAAVRCGRPVQTVVATALAAGASSTHVFGPASSASSFEANGPLIEKS